MMVKPEALMGRIASVPSVLLAFPLVWATGCADSSGPGRNAAATLSGLVVSQPVAVLRGGAAVAGSVRPLAGAGATGPANLVYVSLAPGSVSGGVLATITDQASEQSVTAAVVNGGFDPVAIAANVGDTLVTDITRTGAPSRRAVEEVARRRPPVVVRTNPPASKVDVPLNADIVVVFSTPIDSTTLTTESLQLLRGGTPVPGIVEFADNTHLRAEFHPANLLVSETTYQIVVTQAIRDVNGEALAASVDVAFTTGSGVFAGGLTPATVSAGSAHTCGVAKTGAGYCWGLNDHGQLGDGTTSQRTTPVPIAGGLSFSTGDPFGVGVSAAGSYTCGVATNSGQAITYCWGSNGNGQLGHKNGQDATTPRAVVATIGNRREIAPIPGSWLATGLNHACSMDYDLGFDYCWGLNDNGQLGDGSTSADSAPAPMPTLDCGDVDGAPGGARCPFQGVTAGGAHTCAVASGLYANTHELFCWGANSNGQLGNGTTTDASNPVLVAGQIPFSDGETSAGGAHTCGISIAGAAYCWGFNNDGQLGDGTTTQRPTPVRVAGGLSFSAISAGSLHTCGVTVAGAAYCWGLNDSGQLGDGSTTSRTTPVPVVGGLSFRELSAGGLHTCGVTTAGAWYCWGSNSNGQLGNGTTTSSSVPVKVAGQS